MDQEQIRQRVEWEWGRVKRPGIPELIAWLASTDFYEAPCSTKFHLAVTGGLAEHSCNELDLLIHKMAHYGYYNDKATEAGLLQTTNVAALGHDLCKVNYYKIDDTPRTEPQDYRLRKEFGGSLYNTINRDGLPTKKWASDLIEWAINGRKGDMPVKTTAYKVDDQLPLGHGEKSVSILQDFVKLTPEEKVAIRWHMQAFDAGIHFQYPSGYAFREAADKYPLVTLLFTADLEASQILEAIR